MIEIEWLRQCVREGDYEVASHADEERQDEKISMADLESVVLTGEIIEDYGERKDTRGHACLISGQGETGATIHAVIAKTAQGRMRFCTVYLPKEDRFIDAKFRRQP